MGLLPPCVQGGQRSLHHPAAVGLRAYTAGHSASCVGFADPSKDQETAERAMQAVKALGDRADANLGLSHKGK